METLLFVVEERFQLTSIGLVLTPGLGDNPHNVTIGAPIKLIRPDKSEIISVLAGIMFVEARHISLPQSIKKEDVPVGTEVWLLNNYDD
jgi:hypothetical protein